MSHGHVKPNPDGSKARCGGPGFCMECSLESDQHKLMMIAGQQTFDTLRAENAALMADAEERNKWIRDQAELLKAALSERDEWLDTAKASQRHAHGMMLVNDSLRIKLDKAMEALKQYAEQEDWGYDHGYNTDCDYGHKAREVIEWLELNKTMEQANDAFCKEWPSKPPPDDSF